MNYMNILITIDDNYIDYFYNLLFSLKKNNESLFNIFLVYSNLSEENINNIKKYINDNNIGKLNIIEFDIDSYNFHVNSSYITITAYIRLFAPLLIKEDIDRLLYLDPDIICCGSIEDFYNIDFDNKTLIACENMFHEENYMKNINLGLNYDNIYINSGVLIFNMKKYLKNINENMLIDFISDNSELLENNDQDVFNMLFYEDIKIADNIYNYQIISNPLKVDAALVHYAGSPKPWDDNYEFVLKGIPYYKLLIETGRKNIVKELIIKHSINYAKMINWFVYEENKQVENIYGEDSNLDFIYNYLEDYGYRYGIELYERLIEDSK